MIRVINEQLEGRILHNDTYRKAADTGVEPRTFRVPVKDTQTTRVDYPKASVTRAYKHVWATRGTCI